MGQARASVVIVHGYDDHAGRYQSLGRSLASLGFWVFAFDYRGHGRSDGRRGHCFRFGEYLEDLEAALSTSESIAGGLPVVLLCQSHGALVALRWLTEPNASAAGAVLVSPYLGPGFRLSWVDSLGLAVCSRFLPAFTFGNRLRAEHLTHDHEMVAARKADGLVHGVATARWFTESRRAQREVAERVGRIAIPTLWLIGGDDTVADPHVGVRAYEAVGGEKTLHLYNGFYHEVLNEAGRERVVADLKRWLGSRFPPRAHGPGAIGH